MTAKKKGKPRGGYKFKRPKNWRGGHILLLALCNREGLEPVAEYRAVPERRWRYDIAIPRAKVLIEVHGAVWTMGRHVRGRGFTNDREKMNAAQARGWAVLEYTTGQIEDDSIGVLKQIADMCRDRVDAFKAEREAREARA